MLCYGTLHYIMLCYVILYYAMLCYVILCYAILYYIILIIEHNGDVSPKDCVSKYHTK